MVVQNIYKGALCIYFMQKKGVSAVVATVLIVMITVAAVGVIWLAIVPMIKDKLSSIDVETGSFKIESVCYQESSKTLTIYVHRDMEKSKEMNFSGLNIIYSVDGKSSSWTNNVSLPEGSTKEYTIPFVSGKPTNVKISPLVSVGVKQKTGSVTDYTNNIEVALGCLRNGDLTSGFVDADESIGVTTPSEPEKPSEELLKY